MTFEIDSLAESSLCSLYGVPDLRPPCRTDQMWSHAIAGLPRAGSTALAAVLSQHPRVRVSLDPQEGAIWKSRDAMASAPVMLARATLGMWPRIVCPVRPVVEILASYLSLMRRNTMLSLMEFEARQRGYPATDAGRCDYLTGPHGNVGMSLSALRTAVLDFSDAILLVPYRDLTADPVATLRSIERFFGLYAHSYDFGNLVNPVPEDDVARYALAGLHDVRATLSVASPDPCAVLGDELFERYSSAEWDIPV